MHPLNESLSLSEKGGVLNDERKSLEDISACMESIEAVLNRGELVDNKSISKLIRLVNTHKTLKYDFEV